MDDHLFERSGLTSSSSDRPSWYKAVGIGLAVGSGLFIGVSFVLKKVGLLRANEKYNEVAGEGYGYLKNAYWWSGMTLMIIGEICNFVAYAFTDAILVTPLGALSVVITTILSAIFLKERLSMVGKVACFLCIVGSVVIVMNAPHTSSVSDIQEMQKYVITPGFLSYAGVIIVGSVITALWAGPKWGNKNMLVYISICSWVGGLSVVSTQGIGSAIIAWIDGEPQYKEWFFWVLLVFVITTLLTEIIYLNKALNIFNAALVTPTYYVYFTSTTIITSAILFQGFKGTVTSIVTVVLGFLVICSGVVLLQLSKSAKDVPDSAVFSGDLDQIHTIAEQEQPESEPKADAIRGTAAIMRQISQRRMRMEADELKRMNEEKMMMEQMEPISEDGQPQWEWDGLRRRRTMTLRSQSIRSRPTTASPIPPTPQLPSHTPRTAHLPLGMSQYPTEDEYDDDHDRSTIFSSIAGTIRRNRGLSKGSSLLPYEEHPEGKSRSPMHPVPLTEIMPPRQKQGDDEAGSYYPNTREHIYQQDTEYRGASAGSGQSLAPTPPPHGTHRQFSFSNVFRRPHSSRTPDPTEEERVGLVQEGQRRTNAPGHSRQDSQEEEDTPTESSDDGTYDDHDDKSYDASIDESRDGRRYDHGGYDYNQDRSHGRGAGGAGGAGAAGGTGGGRGAFI